jgi:CRISPR/Cas system-associated endonuclease Cas1
MTGNILLRRQHRLADQPEVAARLAQTIVAAKIANWQSVNFRGPADLWIQRLWASALPS